MMTARQAVTKHRRPAWPALRLDWLLRPAHRRVHREQALERTLDDLAGRLAQTEIALLQEQRRHVATSGRAERAEADLRRVQALLHGGRADRKA
jgi:hypothetical protein